MEESKVSYISSATGLLDITIIRDSRPSVTITLDLGIPNFTVFSIKFPLLEDTPNITASVISEAVYALLDDVAAFTVSCGYDEKASVAIYKAVLKCYKEITGESDTNKGESPISKDPVVKTFEGTFPMPIEFINETYARVVTASGKKIQRTPDSHVLNLEHEPLKKINESDVRRILRTIKQKTVKSQPNPLNLLVVDSTGKPMGSLPIDSNFKNQLLNLLYSKRASKMDWTPSVKFDNDMEMKATNTDGVPKSVHVGDEAYTPFARIENDMGLFVSEKREWLVKFPDGRCVAFTDFPLVDTLKQDNYPVPINYTNWVPLSEKDIPESSDKSEAVDEQGNEVIEGAEKDVNPLTDLKTDDDKNEQLETKKSSVEQISTPQFKAWFRDSKMVDSEGKPQVFYHGTRYEAFDSFRKSKSYAGLIFFSTSKAFASNYASSHVIPVYLRVAKPFDYRTHESVSVAEEFYRNVVQTDVSLRYDFSSQEEFLKELATGRWHILEDEPFVKFLRVKGYDGIYITEKGSLNIAVFSPFQIKSAIGNNGEFNSRSKRITASGYDSKGYWTSEEGASGILPVSVSTGRICLAFRSKHVSHGSCWGTIGGAVQEGMTAKQSAQMELKEETGYSGSIRLVDAYRFKDGSFVYQNYIGLVSSEFPLSPMKGGDAGMSFHSETDRLWWVSWDELQKQMASGKYKFHFGLVSLLKQSGDLIRKICEKCGTE